MKPDVKPGYLVESLPDSAPEKGEGGDKLGEEFAKHVLPGKLFVLKGTHAN